jgi:uncharacterized protein YndB with AHSA1/START domain
MFAKKDETAPKNKTSMELRGDREIVISRTFNAPPRIVFDAWTKADLVRRWWAPKSHCVEMKSCDADVRVGGKYRYVLKHEQSEIAFNGKYVEITPYTRLVYTHVFEMYPDAEMMITATFEDRGDQTHMISHEVYPTAEARAGALASGMEHGMLETMDQLDELVATLR